MDQKLMTTISKAIEVLSEALQRQTERIDALEKQKEDAGKKPEPSKNEAEKVVENLMK